MVHPTLEQLYLDKSELVVQLPQLLDEVVDEREGVVVGLLGDVDGGEAGFELLAQEAALGLYGPLDAGFCDVDLDFGRVWDGGEEVEEFADCNSRALSLTT